MDDQTPAVTTKRKYTRRAELAEAAAGLARMVSEAATPTVVEVRCVIPPDLPGLGGTTTININDPPSKAKGLTLTLHRIGVLFAYADGSLFAIVPYAQIKRIRFDGRPE